MNQPTRADSFIVSLARLIPDRAVVATGVLSWLPMLAIALARATHAPRLTYLNCAGALDPPLAPLPPSSTDAGLLRANPYCLRLTDLWEFAARGALDVMFFGFAQLDPRGNTNLSLLNASNGRPRKLPGVAGALALRQLVRRPVLFTPRHSASAFVPRLDAVTTVAAANPTTVVTDLGVFRLSRGALDPVSLHPSVGLKEVEEKTGFPLRAVRRPRRSPPPSRQERQALEKLDPQKIRDRYLQP